MLSARPAMYHVFYNSVEDLICDGGANEVKNDNVVADPVQYFGSIQDRLEVAFYLRSNFCLYVGERIVGGDIGYPSSIWFSAINSKIGCEDNQGLREIDTI